MIAGAMRPIVCWDCGLIHELPIDTRQALASAQGFCDRHAGHKVGFAEAGLSGAMALRGNADVKLALGTVQTLTVTNLHSLASSATAAWQSAEIDNTANLYLDYLVQVALDFANTAPANSKAAFVFAAGGLETGVLSNPASGSQGAITLTDITTTAQNLKLLGTLPYNTADEVVESSPMSVAAAFGGVVPPFFSIIVANHSGAALAASGNTVKYRGVYATVI